MFNSDKDEEFKPERIRNLVEEDLVYNEDMAEELVEEEYFECEDSKEEEDDKDTESGYFECEDSIENIDFQKEESDNSVITAADTVFENIERNKGLVVSSDIILSNEKELRESVKDHVLEEKIEKI